MIVREYRYGNAIVVIYRPELSDKETKKQETKILTALQQVGKEIKESK